MKSTIITYIMVGSLAFGSNEIFLEQNGSTGTFNITQIGNSNKLGQSSTVSTIDGNDNLFDITQIGNGNSLDVDYTGDSTFFRLYAEGESNSLFTNIIGDQNTFMNVMLGNGNNLNISKDGIQSGSISQSTVLNYIAGFSNDVSLYLDNNIAAISEINLLGNGNTITSIQEGSNLGFGHQQRLNIQGDSNNIQVAQSGSEGQTLELTHFGNDSTFTIIQSDGSYSGGLEGQDVISTFDGNYIQSVGPLYSAGPTHGSYIQPQP